MYLEEKLPKNKDINLLERKEAKHPLLQIILKNTKKENNNIRPKENKIFENITKKKNSSFLLGLDSFKKKNLASYKNDIQDKQMTPKKDNNIKININDTYNEQNNNSINTEDIRSSNTPKNKVRSKIFQLYKSTNDKRQTISHISNNISRFHVLSLNKNLFGSKKISKDENNNEKEKNNKKNNINVNFNNNTIYVSEHKPKLNTTSNDKFIGDKVLLQKSVELNFLRKNFNKNSLKGINLKESYPKIFPNLKINSESININKNDLYSEREEENSNNNNKNNPIVQFKNEKIEINRKMNKRKSVDYTNRRLILDKKEKNQPFITEQPRHFNKRNSFINILHRNNLEFPKLPSKTLETEIVGFSRGYRRKITVSKISSRKLFNNLKKKMLYGESLKTRHHTSIKELITNPIGLYSNINKNKFSLQTNTDHIKKNNNENIIIVQRNPSYYHINKIFNQKYLNKDEDEYIKKKRFKIFEKVLNINKESNLYNNYKEEIKTYFLRNCSVDRITEKIFDNFEPLEHKIEDENDKLEKQEKFLKKICHDVVNDCNRNCFSMKKIVKIGTSLLKEKKIKIKIKIINHYILGMFDIYPQLLKQFQCKWNNKRIKEYYYKKLIDYISSLNYNISKSEYNKRNSIYLDKDFFIFKERMTNELNLNLNYNNINIRTADETKKELKTTNFSYKRKSRINSKIFIFPKKTLDSKNHLLSLFSQDNAEKRESFQTNRKALQAPDVIERKMTNVLRIQRELGFMPRTESFQKFAKLYRIQQNPLTPTNNINKENEDKKKINLVNSEKEMIFNNAKINLDNYNILKNRKIFNYTNNNQINFEKRFSQMYNSKKYKIQLDKKLKIDTMTIKFAGIDQLTKEAALIKTQEIEKDLPDVRLFDKFVSCIQRRKINLFDHLIQKKEEKFNEIINKQEFSTGNTLLIYATQNNLKSLVELLLLKGANPNIQNKFGNSALHIAFKNDNAFIINLLLEYNAEQKLKNINGLLPWQMSKSINN